MDALFVQEKEILEETSKFVAENGTLIYLVYTISKKEGHSTVSDFLLAHPEFSLVKEEQRFPFDEYDTAMYYAVMKKATPLAKEGVPLSELASASKASASFVSSAKPQ
jgi:16S rRNA C967 or C1407 C5-methylase (RsmB/RsmF family)